MESLTLLALVRMELKVWPFEIAFISRFYQVKRFFQIHAYRSPFGEDLHAKHFRKLSKCPKVHLGLQHFYLELNKISSIIVSRSAATLEKLKTDSFKK